MKKSLGRLEMKDEQGLTLVELLVVISLSGLFTGLLLFFMISYWRYGLLLESDLDTLTTRLNAGDFIRENLNQASGLIVQNSLQDNNTLNPDPGYSPAYYWLRIHAIPGTISVGSTGTFTPVIYFKRPSITTSGSIAMNGTQPYEDETVFYLNGSTKSLMARNIANPAVINNRLKTSCPQSLASVSCPADRTIAANLSSIEMRYFSKTGNLIDYTSSYDSSTNTYTGPDFPVVEVVEIKVNLAKKPVFQKTNATQNSAIIRVALRN